MVGIKGIEVVGGVGHSTLEVIVVGDSRLGKCQVVHLIEPLVQVKVSLLRLRISQHSPHLQGVARHVHCDLGVLYREVSHVYFPQVLRLGGVRWYGVSQFHIHPCVSQYYAAQSHHTAVQCHRCHRGWGVVHQQSAYITLHASLVYKV